MTHVMPWAPGTRGTYLQLNAGAFWKCETIADLKSIDVSDPVFISSANDSPIVVYVLGKGLYRYVFGETTTADDAYFIMPNTGTGRWVLELVKGPSFGKIDTTGEAQIHESPSPKMMNLIVDCTDFTDGKATLTIDGSTSNLNKGTVLNRILKAQSISINTTDHISDLTTASESPIDNVSITTSSSNWFIEGDVYVNPERNRLFLCGWQVIRQFNNSISSDLSDFSSVPSFTFTVASGVRIRGLAFSPDGLLMTTCDQNRTFRVYQLTEPCELSHGVTLLGSVTSGSGSSGNNGGICYNNDGTKIFWFNQQNLYFRNLASPYRPDIGSGTANGSVTLQGTGGPFSGVFIDDGFKFLQMLKSDIYQYELTDAYTIATLDNTPTETKTIPGIDTNSNCRGICLTNMSLFIAVQYIYLNDKVLEYSIGEYFSSQINTRTELAL